MTSPFKVIDELGFPVDQLIKHPHVETNKFCWQEQRSLSFFNEVRYAESEKRPTWDLPGHGVAYADCGKVKIKGCDNVQSHPSGKVFRRLYKSNCRRKSCPICYEGWASSESERALIRLSSFIVGKFEVKGLIFDLKKKFECHPKSVFHKELVSRLEKTIKDVKKQRHRGLSPIHVVLSPPQNTRWFADSAYKDNRTLAYKIAKKHGLYGGSLIPHPYRLRCQNCKSTIPEYHKECPKCHNSVFEWFFSPHFHAIGFGYIHGVTKESYQQEGWIIKNLGVRKSVFWTYQYLLSHAGVSRYHTVTWFGRLAYRKLPHVPTIGAVRELCPECSQHLRPLKWCLVDRPPPDLKYVDEPYDNDSWVDPQEWRCLY